MSTTTAQHDAQALAKGGSCVVGIDFGGPTSGANVIARNLVHSLAVSSTSQASTGGGLLLAMAR